MTKMKLVPAEPTFGMVDVGDYYADKCFQAYAILPDSQGFYRTMISAAPNGGKVSRTAVGQIEDALYKLWSDELSEQDVLSRILEALGLEVEE